MDKSKYIDEYGRKWNSKKEYDQHIKNLGKALTKQINALSDKERKELIKTLKM